MLKYFYGAKLTEQDVKMGYISYATLASTFNHVLNKEIINFNVGNWEWYHGYDFSQDAEICEYYIVDKNGADILSNETDEIIFYNANLDMYLWGVTHYGTPWTHVPSDISIHEGE